MQVLTTAPQPTLPAPACCAQVFAFRRAGASEYLGGASEMQNLFDTGAHASQLAEYFKVPAAATAGVAAAAQDDEGGAGRAAIAAAKDDEDGGARDAAGAVPGSSARAGGCFVWVGAHASDAYRQAALRWAALLARFEGAPSAVEVLQGRESELFWRAVSRARAVPGHAFVAVRSAAPLAAYDAEYSPGAAPVLARPVPVLALSRHASATAAEADEGGALGAAAAEEGALERDAATGDIVGPQQRWQTALRALFFVRHLSSY